MENESDTEINHPHHSFEQKIIQNTPEAEQVPEHFERAIKTLANAWFDPKSFEKNPEFYEKLGVRKFKKYMPLTGDVVYRLVWKKLGASDLVKPGNMDSLRAMELGTKLYETAHLTLLSIGVSQMAYDLANNNISGAAFVAGVNVFVNIYPILVQRYNRVRLLKAINKMEESNARKNKTIEI